MTIEREQILFERVIQGQADLRHWRELEALASADADLWRRFAQAQRDEAQLRAEVDAAITVVDGIEAPTSGSPTAPAPVRTLGWRVWAGWAAAAVLAVAWLGSAGVVPTSPGDDEQSSQAGLATTASQPHNQPVTALDRRIADAAAQAQVVGELPKVMIQSEPADDGRTFDVLYMRRILERTRVRSMYSLTEDDAGNPTIIPVDASSTWTNDPL